MPQYHGGCHCGATTYVLTIDKPIEEVEGIGTCNCSICNRRGSVMYYVPKESVVLKGEDNLKLYTFGFERCKHRFCAECGIHVIVNMDDASIDNGYYVGRVGLNLRTLNGIDVKTLKAPLHNGRDEPAFDPKKDEVYKGSCVDVESMKLDSTG